MAYTVKLQKFEGPLDLLLFLIRKHEVDIYDIPIAEITTQYLEYIEIMKALDLEVASEYILMAATLMRIKAAMLLPRPELEEEEEDPRKEIIEKLLEYQKFKEVASSLAELEDKQRDYYPRSYFSFEGNGFEEESHSSENVSLYDLIACFKEVLKKTTDKSYHDILETEISIEEQVDYLLDQIEMKRQVLFIDLISSFTNRILIVATFLAVLELMKRKIIVVRQSSPFGEIWIYKV